MTRPNRSADGRMLKLAEENGKLVRLPVIRKLKEGAANR